MRLLQRWRLLYFRRPLLARWLMLLAACVTLYTVVTHFRRGWNSQTSLRSHTSQHHPLPHHHHHHHHHHPSGQDRPLQQRRDNDRARKDDTFAAHFHNNFRFRGNDNHDEWGMPGRRRVEAAAGDGGGVGEGAGLGLMTDGGGAGLGPGHYYPRLPDDWPQFFQPRSQCQFSLDVFPYRLTANGSCPPALRLLVLVPSHPRHVHRRQAVRRTWGGAGREARHWAEEPGDEEAVKGVRVVFLLGQPDPGDVVGADFGGGGGGGGGGTVLVSEAVKQESMMYGDVVQWEGLQDTYFNLTMKVLLGLRWVTQFCSDVPPVLKADDDTFLHVPRVLRRLAAGRGAPSLQAWRWGDNRGDRGDAHGDGQGNRVKKGEGIKEKSVSEGGNRGGKTGEKSGGHDVEEGGGEERRRLEAADTGRGREGVGGDAILGAFFKSSPCVRQGKYAVSREAYPFEQFPPHVKGNVYVLPGPLVARLVLLAPYLPYSNMEDVHVTGTLARVLHAGHEPFTRREFSVLPASPDPCLFHRDHVTLACQQVAPRLAYVIWDMLMSDGKECGL